MKKQILIASFALCFLAGEAQNRSVKFEDKPLSEVVEMADNQGKLVFLDCYTSWCGPCKRMANDVFTLDRVADFFNSKFVNIKIDMEKGEGPELAKKYGVKAYPTFLLLDGNGKELYRIVGGAAPDDFVKKVIEGMNSENWTSKLDDEYKSGNHSPEFLSKYMSYLSNKGNYDELTTVSLDVWNKLSDEQKQSSEYWSVLGPTTANLEDPRIDYVLANLDYYKNLMGEQNFNLWLLRTSYPSIFPFIMGAHEKDKNYKLESYNKSLSKFKQAKLSDAYANKLIIDLSQARINKDLDKFMDILNECIPVSTDQTRISLLLSFGYIAQQGSPAQKDRGYKLFKDNLQYMSNERTREHIANQISKLFENS